MYTLIPLFVFSLISTSARADGVNWVNPNYVAFHASHPDQTTASAVRAIINRAHSSAKNGPFTITKGTVVAPSGNKQDYLSWAPYHWPDCRWCKKHGTGPHEQSDTKDSGSDSDADDSCLGDSTLDDPLDTVDDPSLDSWDDGLLYTIDLMPSQALLSHAPDGQRRQLLQAKRCYGIYTVGTSTQVLSTPVPSIVSGVAPNDQEAGARKPDQTASCTPSPTTSMPPSATWTTCPYVARDGKVNPDRNQLYALPQLNSFAQSTIDNAIASVLDNNPDAAKNAVKFIDSFFLSPNTGMLPNLAWGQTVRGPEQHGSYMGVLDFRVMVKVANAIQILRMSRSQYWTSEKDSKMIKWTNSYIQWLDNSEIGKRAKKAVNNHSTFFYAQMTALKVVVGDEGAALNAVQAYFAGPFKEQIVSSGEQPFESTRTRAYHYRAFNLEAMMAVAKLGDYLGVNMWGTQTKYKSTIKTALDYLITLDPGQEDPGAAFPLVAAAMAAYGDDENGRYKKFLETGGPQGGKDDKAKPYPYKTKSWWFYEQPTALQHSPNHNKRDDEYVGSLDSIYQAEGIHQDILGAVSSSIPSAVSATVPQSLLAAIIVPTDWTIAPAGATSTQVTSTQSVSVFLDDDYDYFPTYDGPVILHPDRPAPFMSTDAVELEEGIFVYWDQIRHLYEGTASGKRSKWARW